MYAKNLQNIHNYTKYTHSWNSFPFAVCSDCCVSIVWPVPDAYAVLYSVPQNVMCWYRTGPDRTRSSVKFYLDLINIHKQTNEHAHTHILNVRFHIFTLMLTRTFQSLVLAPSYCIPHARASRHKLRSTSVVSWILKRQQSDWY